MGIKFESNERVGGVNSNFDSRRSKARRAINCCAAQGKNVQAERAVIEEWHAENVRRESRIGVRTAVSHYSERFEKVEMTHPIAHPRVYF